MVLNNPSKVWRFMSKKDEATIECNLCKAVFVYHRSTTSLLRHLQNIHGQQFKAKAPTNNKGDQANTRPKNRPQNHSKHMIIDDSNDDFVTEENSSNELVDENVGESGTQGAAIKPGPKPFKPSVVWTIMEKVNAHTVECRLCNSRYAFHHSTTSLLRHIEKNHPEYFRRRPSREAQDNQSNRNKTMSNDDPPSPQTNFYDETNEENAEFYDQLNSKDRDVETYSGSPGDDSRSSRHFKKPRASYPPGRKQVIEKRGVSGTRRNGSQHDNGPANSVVWKFMEKHGESRAACKICKKTFHVLRGRNCNLLKHLRFQHTEEYENAGDEEWLAAYLLKLDETSATEVEAPSMNWTDLEVTGEVESSSAPPAKTSSSSSAKPKCFRHQEPYTNLILTELLPISFVENAAFKSLMKAIDPKLKMPDPKIVEDDIMELYTTHRKQVQEQIDDAPGISLSAEIWEYREGRQYLTVTGHFVSKTWQLRSVILKTVLLSDYSSADLGTSDEINNILQAWNIEKKVTCIVTANTEILTTAMSQLSKPYIQCVATRLNAIMIDSLKSSDYFGRLARKVRCIASLIEHTPGAAEKLAELQTDEGRTSLPVLQDCGSEWISTYKMLNRYQSLHNDILKLVVDETHEGSYSLETEEFDNLRRCVALLEPFVLAGEELASESFSSLSKTVAVFEILQQMLSSRVKDCLNHESVSGLAKELNKHLEHFIKNNIKNEANLLHYTASLLDPRFRPSVTKDVDICSKVEFGLQQQLAEITKELETEQEEKSSELLLECNSDNHSSLSLLWSSFDYTVKASVREKPVNELNRYMEEIPVSRQENPLLYWKDREPLYPKLCSIVKKFLSIPGTSVPASQIFSGEEKKKACRRSFLEESNLDSVLFLNSCRSMT